MKSTTTWSSCKWTVCSSL